MRIHKTRNRSSILNRDMPVSMVGHFGTPIIVFPTANQDFEEYERQGMFDVLGSFIESGMVKLYCVSSINGESWMNDRLHPAERAYLQALYDRHVVEELVPLIYQDCCCPVPSGDQPNYGLPIATIGSSFGAYHAANSLLKHPEIFRWCIAMSGVYDMSAYFEGHQDQNCFENNPVDYVPKLRDPKRLAELQRCSLNIICGQGPWERVEWSKQLPAALAKRGIKHNFDLWGHDVAHDWPWWKIQLKLYIPRLFS